MKNKTLLASIGILAVAAGIAGYSLYSYKRTVKNIRAESVSLAGKLDATQMDLQTAQDAVLDLQKKLSLVESVLLDEQKKALSVASQVDQVSTKVGVLDKLSRTDTELLKQYSKVYFLNEHYVPISLTDIPAKYIFTAGKKLQIHSNVAPHLSALLDDADASGISLFLDSAYRSFGTQAVLKSAYKVTYGAGTANAFSAEQGYSEHQLGTAVDFTASSINGGLAGFDKTVEYLWLTNNAYRYGFVISYPNGNTSYVFEPWHWRFVGIELAQYMHQNNLYFYTMDQRVIDTYLANIFD